MLSLRSARALEAAATRGKATVAQPQPQPRADEEEAGQQGHGQRQRLGLFARAAPDRQAELHDQLQEREVRIPVPWGHVAGAWWGRTDQRPLLALHGWGDNAGSFQRLSSSLRGVPVLALDLPGHGLSSRLPRGVAPADRGLLLAVVRRVQRALGLTSLSLVGHSLGDAVALQYAAAYPADVDMYVSLDTLVPAPASADGEIKSFGGQLDELLEAEETLDEPPRTATRAQLVSALVAGRSGSLNMHAAETLLRRGAHASQAGLTLTLDPRVSRSSSVLSGALSLACARSVRCPTLAVLPQWRCPRALAADEELRERFLADLRMAAKTVTAVSVTGTHHAHLNSPEVVVPSLQEFLDEHRGASQAFQTQSVEAFFV
ncbi:putative serine hydrolase [Frankliniella fusca]|uniref:Serine hydrolase n=1 Tax=Frankliniella fusca TaxID=407009 RepID=A0AAE1GQP3_9NEOP|nr:putative serine hydrolase [Frankliniella fusca]